MNTFRANVQRKLEAGNPLYTVHIRHLSGPEAGNLKNTWQDRASMEVEADE